MKHSTRLGCTLALFLFLTAHSTNAQDLQTDGAASAAANELAKTYSQTISVQLERFFGSAFLFQNRSDDIAPFRQALSGRFEEIYVDVAAPILARRLATEEMRLLTEEFKGPAFQAFTIAFAEAAAMMMPCISSKLDSLPKPQETYGEEQRRLARQLWELHQATTSSPPQTDIDAANPPIPEELRERFAGIKEEMRQRSDCVDDGATAILATRLTAEHLKTLIALEQSAPMQKLHAVGDEVSEQLGLKLSEAFWDLLRRLKRGAP